MAKKRYNRSERRVIESAQMNLHAIFKHIRTFDNPPLMWNAVLLCCSTSQVQQRQLTIFASNKQCGRRHPAKKSKSQLTRNSYVRYGKTTMARMQRFLHSCFPIVSPASLAHSSSSGEAGTKRYHLATVYSGHLLSSLRL